MRRRNAGSPGDAKAARYISEEVEQLGWEPEMRSFPLPQGGSSWNVIGAPPGFDASAGPYVIVGGHYDSLNGPGANDNATGIAIALEIARLLDERPGEVPVLFIAFGAEERQPTKEVRHHIGSQYYVAHMSPAEKENLRAMVNVDMVGVGSPIQCGRMSSGPREGTDRCLAVARDLGIPARLRVTPDWSDNGTFLRAGLNAAWVWTGEFPCCYHNPRDTADRIRPGDFRRSGALAYGIVRSYTR
jgi:Zn-dependent M28 family amino/carboxypeptidase